MPKPKSLLRFEDILISEFAVNDLPNYLTKVEIGNIKLKECLVLSVEGNIALNTALRDLANLLTNCIMKGMPMPPIILSPDYKGLPAVTKAVFQRQLAFA